MSTTRLKTTRLITDSELVSAMKNSMGPIFEHFEKVIAEVGGSAILQIEITADAGKVKLNYVFRPANTTNQ